MAYFLTVTQPDCVGLNALVPFTRWQKRKGYVRRVHMIIQSVGGFADTGRWEVYDGGQRSVCRCTSSLDADSSCWAYHGCVIGELNDGVQAVRSCLVMNQHSEVLCTVHTAHRGPQGSV